MGGGLRPLGTNNLFFGKPPKEPEIKKLHKLLGDFGVLGGDSTKTEKGCFVFFILEPTYIVNVSGSSTKIYVFFEGYRYIVLLKRT